MTRTLVLGDPVVTLGAAPVIADGAVIVEGEHIVEAGPRQIVEQHGPFDAVLGGPGHVVMPGFVNGHYHSECWTAPGLIGTIFELTNLLLGSGPAQADEEAVELLATYGLVQCLRGGQTATVDAFYGKPGLELFGAEPYLRAYEKVGLRTAFGLSLRDQNIYVHQDDETFLSTFPPELAAEVAASPLGYAWPVDDVLDAHAVLVERWEGRDGRFHFLLAPDWTPACSDDLLRRCRKIADDTGSGMTIHVLETRAELRWNQRTYGKPAVQRLADLGVLGEDVTLSHFVWATDDDLAVFVDSGAVAASNAGSNLRLSSGICRVRDILERGGRVCFGTDGISSTEREDFFAELRLAALLQRMPDRFMEHRLDSLTLLRAAGDNGARAIGRPGELGRLEHGMLADLLLLRRDRVFFPPGRFDQVDPLDVLVDRADASDIDTVMVGGRVLLDAGRVTGVDEAALLDRIRELGAERLFAAPTAESRRWQDLVQQLLPRAVDMYDDWYSEPIPAPAAVYNSRLGVGSGGGDA
jgi:5-methylthioadenosine/S-adenosylhomocysteine deaminase